MDARPAPGPDIHREGAAARRWWGLAGVWSEEAATQEQTPEPHARRTRQAGYSAPIHIGEPVKAPNYGSDNEMIRRSDNGNACRSAYHQGAFSDHLIF
jgi:hypothetical protein